jgi:hypothetical protein
MRKMDGSRISFREDEARGGRTGLGYELMGGSRDSRRNVGVSSASQNSDLFFESNAVVEGLRH